MHITFYNIKNYFVLLMNLFSKQADTEKRIEKDKILFILKIHLLKTFYGIYKNVARHSKKNLSCSCRKVIYTIPKIPEGAVDG